MTEDTIRLAISNMAYFSDEKYRAIAQHFSALHCELVGTDDPHDAILRFGDEQEHIAPDKTVEENGASTIWLLSDTSYMAPPGSRHYLYSDDGLNRVNAVLQMAVQKDMARAGKNYQHKAAMTAPPVIVDTINALQGSALFAMMISLGQLPLMNNRHGRSTINTVLQLLQQKLALFARDSLGRDVEIGRTADGFFVLIDSVVDRTKWQWMAGEIVTMVRDTSLDDQDMLMLSANIALARRRPDEAVDQFVKRLVAGLEHAQNDASTHVKWADRDTDLDQIFSTTLEHDLAEALNNGEIVVRFQPQFSLQNGHLTGAEALARWEHPKMGELGASILFNVAERAGLMQPLSEYIQLEALQKASQWPAALSDLRLSINLTAYDFAAPDFVARFGAMLKRSQFNPQCLTVEITETDLISNLDRASKLCVKLREQGMRVAIDDFGTGFSSLLYLKSLPLDYLKLDGAMSVDIEGSPRDRVIVRSIIALGRALNLELVAEGVETEEQRDLLAEEGCQYYQGYLGGKAMHPDDFITFALRAN